MKKYYQLIWILILFLAGSAVVFADGMAAAPPISAKDSFFAAVNRGDVATAKSFLDSKQVSINDKDDMGNTAMMIAVNRIDLPMVIALIQYKPDVSAKNSRGQTVMDIAETKGNAQLTTTLKQAGF
ncbi:MAG: ankyrin repeat domain-containing protein [Spirochaetales bacterium]|nr:ankyrin repeat domain-containing protein [Spirochaetales bacterium]